MIDENDRQVGKLNGILQETYLYQRAVTLAAALDRDGKVVTQYVDANQLSGRVGKSKALPTTFLRFP